jgi:Xaa-Pro aminopeptidase
MRYAERLRRLGQDLELRGVGAMLVSNPINIRYLTGFSGSNAMVIVRPQDAVFMTDFRYLERVKPIREFIDVKQVSQEIMAPAAEQLVSMVGDGATAGFEGDDLSYTRYAALAQQAGAGRLKSVNDAVERLRTVKDDEELDIIRRAADLLEGVYAGLAEGGFAGRTERDVAWRIIELLHEAGADGPSFSAIVASGERGALPHAEPADVEIPADTLVTIDLGALVDGYCSDCTRTFATGAIPEELDEAYRIVQHAQQVGLDAVRPGVTGKEVDAVVRDLIAEAGHGDHFQHGTGHGVGLDIHEHPRLNRTGDATLEPGMVVTVEPGIYLPGVGGVRIEDLVIVTADGAERLTGYPKDLITTG